MREPERTDRRAPGPGRVSRYRVLLCAAVLLTAAKHLLVARLPIEARHYGVDDYLMLQMAEGLLKGNWLGDYAAATLMKGCFFPILLAAFSLAGIPYLSGLNLLHSLACLFFARQMKPVIRRRAFLPLLYLVLLFDPCSCAQMIFQRVYRSAIMETQVLFLYGAFFGLYFQYRFPPARPGRRHAAARVFYAVLCGAALWAMWNTREESMWVLPFAVTATVLTAAEIPSMPENAGKPLRRRMLGGAVLLLPFLILLSGNRLVAGINERVYGARVRLEVADGNFGKALKTIYSIENARDVPRVSVTREKLERLYALSPSLALIRAELDEQVAAYAAIDLHPKDGEAEDGFFFWGLKAAAFQNGIADTLPGSQAYWQSVREELLGAIGDPDSGLRTRPAMPSALMSPWREAYGREMISAMRSAFGCLVSFRDAAPSAYVPVKGSPNTARRFELMTGNLAMYPSVFHGSVIKEQSRRLQPACAVLTRIGDLYRALNKPAAAVSLCLYVLLLVRCLKTKDRALRSACLAVLGMGLSVILYTAGVCYTHISAFPAVSYYYLIGAYPLMLACEATAVFTFVQAVQAGPPGRSNRFSQFDRR